MSEGQIIIGTDANDVAIAAGKQAYQLLKQAHPTLNLAIRPFENPTDESGVRLADIDTLGVFLYALHTALLNHEVRIAAHVYRQLPTALPEGVVVGAVPARVDVRDVFVSPVSTPFVALEAGARVGVEGLREKCLLLSLRGDLEMVIVEEGITALLKRMGTGDLVASVMPMADLARIGLSSQATEAFPASIMLPAPAQGAIALLVREDDAEARELLKSVHDPVTGVCCEAERAVLDALGGGTHLPLGALAEIGGSGRMSLQVALGNPAGGQLLRTRAEGPQGEPDKLGRALGEKLLASDAAEILQTVRYRVL